MNEENKPRIKSITLNFPNREDGQVISYWVGKPAVFNNYPVIEIRKVERYPAEQRGDKWLLDMRGDEGGYRFWNEKELDLYLWK